MGKRIYKTKIARENLTKRSGIILVSLFVVLITSCIFFVEEYNSLIEYSNSTQSTYALLQQLQRSFSFLKDAESSIRGFIITQDKKFLDPLDSAKAELPATMDSLQKLMSTSPNQINTFKILHHLELQKLQLIDNSKKFAMFSDVQKDSLYIAMLYDKNIMDQYRIYEDQAARIELDRLDQHRKELLYYQGKVPQSFKLFFILICVLTISMMIWLSLELRRRVSYESELQQKVTELDLSNSELEQIAFAASHDLQEPLRKIRIFSDRLLMILENKESESLMLTKRIGVFAKRLQELILDLVQFNELVQQKKTLSYFNASEIVAEVKKSFDVSLQKRNAVVHCGELPRLYASKEETEIVFMQLFSNSLQFAAEERRLEIKISAEEIEGSMIDSLPLHLKQFKFHHIIFSDNGIGFDIEFKSKLFQPFQRLHNNVNDTEKGRPKGMGLAMCKRVMLNAGGSIDADSRENKGTSIHLYFPFV